MKCMECGAHIKVPKDSEAGEIVDCPDCGTGYELVRKKGKLCFQASEIIGEDWGE